MFGEWYEGDADTGDYKHSYGYCKSVCTDIKDLSVGMRYDHYGQFLVESVECLSNAASQKCEKRTQPMCHLRKETIVLSIVPACSSHRKLLHNLQNQYIISALLMSNNKP